MATGESTGLDRRLIFENYANGVDIESLKATFRRSAAEIEAEIFFVARKIKEYRFRRCADGSPHAAPPIACDTLIDIRLNRLALFDTLRKLGDLYLSSALLLPKVNVQKVDHPSALLEAAHRVRASQ
jgi:hypothetical protein